LSVEDIKDKNEEDTYRMVYPDKHAVEKIHTGARLHIEGRTSLYFIKDLY
jgi:hypothetical protein